MGGREMKHVPKGARFACARALTDILQSINSNPSGTEQWRQLLWFASNILTQPERAGRRRNLANLVKRRIENHEMLRTKDDEEREEGGSGRCPSAKDRRLAAVGAKLEEGNIRAPTHILCSLQSRLSGHRDAGVLSSNARKTPEGQLGGQPG